MACNENIVKNMASEVARNCASQVAVDSEFVVYLIDLLLLNPKYGKLFTRTLNRTNLQYFVEECGNLLKCGGTSVNTLKMQFIIQSNYDKLETMIEKRLASIENCLKPLVGEILDEDPDPNDEQELTKLFRKISIYSILSSGLGNPGNILTLKEGMSALESVFSLNDLKQYLALPRSEKMKHLTEIFEVASGVRLFNRDCKKGGEGIPDLPYNLVDAGKACLTALSNSLIGVMQKVNTLTTAIEDCIIVNDETGNVQIKTKNNLSTDDYKQVFDLLIFHRQYEVFIRKLLTDVENMVYNGSQLVEKFKKVLEDLHGAVKYKAAVPVIVVFRLFSYVQPLFQRLWCVWRSMQNVMYLVSVVSRLMSALSGAMDHLPSAPQAVIDQMLAGRNVRSDQDRMSMAVPAGDRLSLASIKNYRAYNNEDFAAGKDKYTQYLGFCTMSLTVGALVPGLMKVGVIKNEGKRYGFSSVRLATKFSKDPQRYINEVLNYARNNPHVINLLNIVEDVYNVKDIDVLVVEHLPPIKVHDKDVQTETHPIEGHMEKNYTWDLWEWKRRACQWANIVNCRTHSTQTDYSHLRSEIQCQTYEYRDKCEQTRKDSCINTEPNKVFIWGLRGRLGEGQHNMDLGGRTFTEKKKAEVITTCAWPCINTDEPIKRAEPPIVRQESSTRRFFYH